MYLRLKDVNKANKETGKDKQSLESTIREHIETEVTEEKEASIKEEIEKGTPSRNGSPIHFHNLDGEIPSQEVGDNTDKFNSAWIDYLEKVIPILEDMNQKIKGKKTNLPTSNRPRLLFILKKLLGEIHFKELDMRGLYDDLPQEHFLYTSNLASIAQLKPLNLYEVQKSKSLYDIVEADSLIEQVKFSFYYLRLYRSF